MKHAGKRDQEKPSAPRHRTFRSGGGGAIHRSFIGGGDAAYCCRRTALVDTAGKSGANRGRSLGLAATQLFWRTGRLHVLRSAEVLPRPVKFYYLDGQFFLR